MHPAMQGELATIHQNELIESVQDDHLLAQAAITGKQRTRWVPSSLHKTLALLRLRHRSRRMRLRRRRYATSWQHDLREIIDEP